MAIQNPLEDVAARLGLHRASRMPRLQTPARPTGFPSLDRALGGGLPENGLVEVAAPHGGLSSFLHRLAATHTRKGEHVAWIDPGHCLDVAGLEAAGVELGRLLWLPVRQHGRLPAMVDLLLASGLTPLVLLDLAHAPGDTRPAPPGAWVRLARRAEHHGTLLVCGTRQPVAGAAAATLLVLDPPRPCWHGAGETPTTLEGAGLGIRVLRRRHGPGPVTSGLEHLEAGA
ncbi:MAG: hypothetical protein VKO21_05250 [Candidatus Sericytochromatia bacterium]|nr:hypothetical protein [Candidatus Sericytochromatia bacterium]